MKNYLLIFSRFCLFLSFTFHVCIAISPLTKSTRSSLQDQRLVTRLIHRDSILSPTYNKDSTISDRANFAIKSSEERLANLNAIANYAAFPTGTSIAGSLVPNGVGSIFFINVSVGEPPVSQLLIFDTGSPLVWVQCARCPTCRRTKLPRYKPNKSSTYAPIACHPIECRQTYRGNCDSNGYCEYTIRYHDQTTSSGTVAYEKFTFPAYNRGTSVLPSLIFGCGTKHNDNVSQSNGVFGLSAGKASPLTSLGPKFSYCLGSILDPLDLNNFVVVGDEAILDGYPTPFQTRYGLYYVTLENITVNYVKNITASPKEFKFNVVFDTGSSLTYLAKSLYEPLKAEVKAVLSRAGLRSVPAYKSELLCYIGIMSRDLPDSPVTLHLPGVAIDLNRDTLFFQAKEDAFCMAIDMAKGANIIGVLNQQFSNIGFDLQAKKLTYRTADCDFLARSYNL